MLNLTLKVGNGGLILCLGTLLGVNLYVYSDSFVICEVRLTLSELPKDVIYEDSDPVDNDGCMFIPIMLGSDKMTVSVSTGDIEYHTLYFSLGPFHNSVR